MARIRRKNLQSQFWDRIDRRGDDECWLWIGQLSKKGYGFGWFRFGNFVTRSAHRASWIIHNGQIPDGLCVCHRCDNPPCVNPGHLFLGTNVDNVNDRVAKERTQRGSRHFKARVTEDDVRAIRASGRRKCDLAREYGLAYETIVAILTRRTWKHVE